MTSATGHLRSYGCPFEVIEGGDVQHAAFIDTDRGKVEQPTADGAFSIDGLRPPRQFPR
ncbi:MAG: hypothetical protein U0231_05715 [Nitrospiraceae bacterium]